ncbi:MAG: LuxR family transcriptional regulator [Acidobacteriaceae bacterium]|nr:LuxR family transcriptional regulator [Acidobacteriaceae bacterium]
MWDTLTAREKHIAELLLQGCDNDEIAQRTGIATRTVKADIGKMFQRFQISGGVKRVKLATLLYRSQISRKEPINLRREDKRNAAA